MPPWQVLGEQNVDTQFMHEGGKVDDVEEAVSAVVEDTSVEVVVKTVVMPVDEGDVGVDACTVVAALLVPTGVVLAASDTVVSGTVETWAVVVMAPVVPATDVRESVVLASDVAEVVPSVEVSEEPVVGTAKVDVVVQALESLTHKPVNASHESIVHASPSSHTNAMSNGLLSATPHPFTGSHVFTWH